MLSRRRFLGTLLGASAFGAAGTGAYANVWERHSVEITRIPLALGLPTPLKLAAVSDIHFDPLFETDYVRGVMQRIAALEPDLVCHTGDFVTRSTERFGELAALMAIPKPPLGSFAVMGNHDRWADHRLIAAALEACGICVLQNASVPIPGSANWRLAGLDSYWGGTPIPAAALRGNARTLFILLVHEPDPFDTIVDSRVRLQISGHTHGGQIRAPFFGAPVLPSWGRNYDAGLFRKDGRCLYVTRGIGTVSIPMRFRCPPEITLFDLT